MPPFPTKESTMARRASLPIIIKASKGIAEIPDLSNLDERLDEIEACFRQLEEYGVKIGYTIGAVEIVDAPGAPTPVPYDFPDEPAIHPMRLLAMRAPLEILYYPDSPKQHRAWVCSNLGFFACCNQRPQEALIAYFNPSGDKTRTFKVAGEMLGVSGSHTSSLVHQAFSEAHDRLQERIDAVISAASPDELLEVPLVVLNTCHPYGPAVAPLLAQNVTTVHQLCGLTLDELAAIVEDPEEKRNSSYKLRTPPLVEWLTSHGLRLKTEA